MGIRTSFALRRNKIGDADFLHAVARAREIRPEDTGASRWDIASILGGREDQVVAHAADPLAPYSREIDGVDPKAVLAVARRLIRRGEVEGCLCGCPGWFTIVHDVLPSGRHRSGADRGDDEQLAAGA
ncbi:MAG: hypothetical protein ACTHMS_10770 [Jatrophihabitans sp.]|uniref:hypothetical protein n=1 Tax=Jatrophihabitans sp. TaxID=1932789 RepID=UPI003F8054A7